MITQLNADVNINGHTFLTWRCEGSLPVFQTVERFGGGKGNTVLRYLNPKSTTFVDEGILIPRAMYEYTIKHHDELGQIVSTKTITYIAPERTEESVLAGIQRQLSEMRRRLDALESR